MHNLKCDDVCVLCAVADALRQMSKFTRVQRAGHLRQEYFWKMLRFCQTQMRALKTLEHVFFFWCVVHRQHDAACVFAINYKYMAKTNANIYSTISEFVSEELSLESGILIYIYLIMRQRL